MRAGGVVADHPTQVRPTAGGDIGAELQVVRTQGRVELLEHHARLDPHQLPLGIEFEDAVHVPAEIEHHRPRDRLARKAGAAAARQDSGPMLSASEDCRLDIVARARAQDPLPQTSRVQSSTKAG